MDPLSNTNEWKWLKIIHALSQCYCVNMCISALIHCDFVMPYGKIDLGQHWLILWLVFYGTQPLTWLSIKSVLGHSPESNFTRSSNYLNLQHVLGNDTFGIIAAYLRAQLVTNNGTGIDSMSDESNPLYKAIISCWPKSEVSIWYRYAPTVNHWH